MGLLEYVCEKIAAEMVASEAEEAAKRDFAIIIFSQVLKFSTIVFCFAGSEC